jgi:hypothetical protein
MWAGAARPDECRIASVAALRWGHKMQPNTMRITLSALAWLVTAVARGGAAPPSRPYWHQANFAVPKAFYSVRDYHPVAYLETYPVADTTEKLSADQKRRLIQLFLAAYDACQRKYHQDYLLHTNAPIYELLVANDRRVADLPPREGGRVMFLGAIASVLRPAKTMPGQRP